MGLAIGARDFGQRRALPRFGVVEDSQDGRNEELTFTVAGGGGGSFTFTLTAEEGTTGEYLLVVR